MMTKINEVSYTILHGDCLDRLKDLPDNSVESVVTDPPYGLSKEPNISEVLTKWVAGEPYDHGHGGFMGKSWDSFVPHPDIWREVHRVLKPGGHALVFSGTRTQDLMTVSLRLAGFEVRDVIEWLYFSGFPKSHDVGKAFDRRAPRVGLFDRFARHFDESFENSRLSRRELAVEFPHYKNVDSFMAQVSNWRLGKNVPSAQDFKILQRTIGLSDDWDVLIGRVEAEREKVGEKAWSNSVNHFVPGEDHTERVNLDITAPTTELARKWDGWGTALKPAHEPIIVVRKPLAGTVADNVEEFGTGAINIDASRIGRPAGDRTEYGVTGIERKGGNNVYGRQSGVIEYSGTEGRFPANCITFESDEFYSKYFNVSPAELSKKAAKKDRNSDWQGEEIMLEPKQARTYGEFVGVPDNPQQTTNKRTVRANYHPTVKPTDLMAWLVRLVTPPNGIVLDPFAGSGSTLVAAKREGFGFIGVEREAEYIEIIEARTGEKAEVVA